MKKLPLGLQTFRDILEKNYLYVDKTEEIYKLVSEGGKYFFLSRPRRFGKSLLISTLKEVFSGNKKLFRDLWIYDRIEWKEHPVIHIDFSAMDTRDKEIFLNSLNFNIDSVFRAYNLEVMEELDYKDKFSELIKQLSLQGKVVILIDEYDKPIIDFIDKPEQAAENREILKNFYEVIKSSDQYIRFAFLTGVSKFSRVSVFSGLNNLRDITLSKEYSTLLGYTQAELLNYFDDYLNLLAKKLDIKKDFLISRVKDWYNGYSWDGENFVYNPFSILSLFIEKQFSNYWFTSGTPTFLIKKIKESDFEIEEFENYESDGSIFDSYNTDKIDIPSLLFQTGYLTIKKVVNLAIDMREYILSYPNLEVKESLLRNITWEC